VKGTCPSCGCGGSLSLFIADADARKAVLAAARLPSDCGVAVLKYIGYFSPAERFLTAARAAKLIEECCDMIVKGVDFDRTFIQVPSRIWAQSFAVMEASEIRRPLKNHHYLLRIVQGESAKKWDAPVAKDASADVRVSPAPRATASLQKVSDVFNPEPSNAEKLQGLATDAREALLKQARESLLKEGFKEPFIGNELIQMRAVELMAVTS